MKKRVLIIKSGWSETIDPDESGIVSLGDILRSTVILHQFPPEEYEVTWVVDQKGVPLLQNNPYIARLLSVNTFTPHLLLSETFDILINLEKDLGICAMCERLHAWERYGFRFHQSELRSDKHSEEALKFTQDEEAKRLKDKSWSQVLYEMLGKQYNGEQYILDFKTQEIKYDVGLNHLIGKKFPTKAWTKYNWEGLELKLAVNGYKSCWQQGESDLESYINWIASCKTIVTCDSLGLHIGLALGKNVVALFGPTLASEVHDCKNLTKIISETGKVADITVEEVMKVVERFE